MVEFANAHPPPSELFSQCAALGIPTIGNAAGLNSTTDLNGLTIGPFPVGDGDEDASADESSSAAPASTSGSVVASSPTPESSSCPQLPCVAQPYNPEPFTFDSESLFEADVVEIGNVEIIQIVEIDTDADMGL